MIIRQGNWLPQQRIDIPHLRALESSAVHDFDLLAGQLIAGEKGAVVKGFEVPETTGIPASQLFLNVAKSMILHPTGSENGTLFATGASDAPISLGNSPFVTGSFIASSTNYVSIDLRRVADPDSADTVKFLDPDTKTEYSRIVPISRILTFHVYISTQEFEFSPHLLPIAIVETDENSNVVSVTDARPMLFRLGEGGSVPSSDPIEWKPQGDKSIGSLKEWMDAVMTRLWELGGGDSWYSESSDRDIKVAYGKPVLPDNSNNFFWEEVGGKVILKWSGIRVLFTNSPATYNEVQANEEGVLFPDGHCLCVDVDRNTEGAEVVPFVRSFDSEFGRPSIPGSRIILAWRKDIDGEVFIYVRDRETELDRDMSIASTATLGGVKLYQEATDPANPRVLTDSMMDAASGVAGLDANGHLNASEAKGGWKANGDIEATGRLDVGGDVSAGGIATVKSVIPVDALGQVGGQDDRWNEIYTENLHVYGGIRGRDIFHNEAPLSISALNVIDSLDENQPSSESHIIYRESVVRAWGRINTIYDPAAGPRQNFHNVNNVNLEYVQLYEAPHNTSYPVWWVELSDHTLFYSDGTRIPKFVVIAQALIPQGTGPWAYSSVEPLECVINFHGYTRRSNAPRPSQYGFYIELFNPKTGKHHTSSHTQINFLVVGRKDQG